MSELLNFKKQPKGFSTKAIHVGQNPDQWNHLSIVPPIVTAATFKQNGPGEPKMEYKYGRGSNPTRSILEKCLASLDNGKFGLTFASGLGALTAITELAVAGDHILACNDLYGGTYRFFQRVAINHGLTIDYVDPSNLDAIKDGIKSNTKIIWLESPSNPSLKIADIESISKIAHECGNIIVAVDNSFLSAYFQRPLELGADIVMYSLTKYMNGHSDVIMGAAIINSDELYERLKFIQNATGIVPSPFDCYQVNRGLKTLALRMKKHQKNALIIAKFLEQHPNVEKVLHPGLSSHPQHKLAVRQCYGHSGALSFYIKGTLETSLIFLKKLNIFMIAESIGGYESLASLPTQMSHLSLPPDERKHLGITDTLIRLSIGLEDADDLIEDLDQALRASKL